MAKGKPGAAARPDLFPMATEYEFFFTQYDFSQGGLGQEPQASQMRKATREGWELVNTNLAHPYVFALWQRVVGEQQNDAEGSTGHVQGLRDDVAAAQARVAELQESLANMAAERDAAQRDAAQHAQEKHGLQQALTAQQQRAESAEARLSAQQQAEQEAPSAQERDES